LSLNFSTLTLSVTGTFKQRKALVFSLLWILFGSSLDAMPRVESLDRLKAKKSVLVVFAPNASDARLQEQKKALRDTASQLSEKSVAIFYVFPKEAGRADSLKLRAADAPALHRRLQVKPEQFRVVLVGKDGRVSSRYESPLPSDALQALLGSL